MILTFFKSILILIITSLAIHYSQNVFRGFSILVCIGVQVFFRGFIFHSSSRTWLALALASRLPPFDRKTLKNCSCSEDLGLHNETKGSWFSFSCLSPYQNGWWEQIFFFLPHQHSDKEIFLGVSQGWKLWKIFPEYNTNWNEHSFTGLLPGDVS